MDEKQENNPNSNGPNTSATNAGQGNGNGASLAVSAGGLQVASPGALAQEAARPAILRAPPTPIDLLRALQRRWLAALILGFCVATPPALYFWFVTPADYSTMSWLRMRSGNTIFKRYSSMTELPVKGHVKLIKSHFVLNQAIREEGISSLPMVREAEAKNIEPSVYLAQRINVSVGSGLMNIAMSGNDPHELRSLVNAITDAYLLKVVAEEHKAFLKQRDEISKTYKEKVEELKKMKSKLEELAVQLGTASTSTADAKQELLVTYVGNLRTELLDLRRRIYGLDREIVRFKTKYSIGKDNKAPPGETLINEWMESDVELQQAKKDLVKMQETHGQLKSLLKNPSKDRRYRSLTADIKATKEKIKSLENTILKDIEQQIAEGRLKSPIQEQLDLMVGEVEQLLQEREEIYEEFLTSSSQIERIGSVSAEIENRLEEISNVRRVTYDLGLKLEQMEIEKDSESRIQLIEQAQLKKSGDYRARNRLTMMAGFGGLGVALLAVALFEFHARRMTTAEEMSEGLGVHVMGDVPILSERGWRFFGRGASDIAGALQGAMDESIDSIRSMLLHSAQGETLRVVMVTSANAGEGKTTVASSLAASMGRSGRRTLLIDADLRRPSVHRLLDLPLDAGLSELLRGEAKVEEVIQPSRAPGLWVMSAGHINQASLQALAKDNLREIFETLRGEFDYIIIDTSPVLAVVDPLLVAPYTDGVILSVVRKVSQMSNVYDTCERVKGVGGRLLGCVVNGVKTSRFGLDYYGYGYGYGYQDLENAPREHATE